MPERDATEPSGPVRPVPFRVPRSERAVAAVLAMACLAVLVVAAWLNPSAEGHGTHTQLGLNDCAWVMLFDKPCMTCGMTTAFSFAAEAHPIDSIRTQPMGAFLAGLTAVLVWVFGHVALTGSSLGRVLVGWVRLRVVLTLLAMAALAWGYKLLVWVPGSVAG